MKNFAQGAARAGRAALKKNAGLFSAAALMGAGSFGAVAMMAPPKKAAAKASAPAGPTLDRSLGDTGTNVPDHSWPEPRPDLPTFTLEELLEHCDEKNAWTSFKGAVYDISKFIDGHPGGKPRLMMAAGGDLETYWAVYPEQHLRGHVVPWLDAKLRIGNLSPADAAKASKMVKFDNYYKDDPVRVPDLLHNTHHPFNGEPRIHLLTDNYLTPNELHYVRNHLSIPDLDPEEYTLEVGGLDIRPRVFTLKQLKSGFKKVEVVNTLQCAGNRREDFHGTIAPDGKERKIFIGPHWVSAAFSCARWGGVRMRDVLKECGLDVDGIYAGTTATPVKHVQFESYDVSETGLAYGASVPIDKVCDPQGDVLCAFEMNGEDVPRDHGYPVRALIPGHAGARSAKFLHKITLTQEESHKPWQIHAYRGFAPDITFEDDLWQWTNSPTVRLDQAQIIQELPVQSLCCNPPPNAVIGGCPDSVVVKGVAHGWGKGIARVDVSIDDGVHFTAAETFKPELIKQREMRNREWAWHHFCKELPLTAEQKAQLKRGERVTLNLVSKAVDGHHNVQPERPDSYYNSRGVAINHMYRYPITIDPKAPPGVHIPTTAPNAYEGFGNVPTGGKYHRSWKVGPWKEGGISHEIASTFNNEKDTKTTKYK